MEVGPDELEGATPEERNDLSDKPLDDEGGGPTPEEAGPDDTIDE